MCREKANYIIKTLIEFVQNTQTSAKLNENFRAVAENQSHFVFASSKSGQFSPPVK